MKFGEYITEVSKLKLKEYGVIKAISIKCKPFIKEFKNSGCKDVLWRGTQKDTNKTVVEVRPRTDRMPKDMPPEIHNEFDYRFRKKFGWYVRGEGVFTVSKRSTAESYGTGMIFLPVGEYEYVYNPEIDDLYSHIDSDMGQFALEDFDDDFEYDWNNEYGKGEQGSWYYDGIDTEEQDIDQASVVAAEAEGLDIEDFSRNDFEWVPEVSYEEYVEQKRKEQLENAEENFEEVVKGYRDSNLNLAIMKKVEVVFKCKSYFLIDAFYEKPILDYMIHGKVDFDPAQMEFEFEKNPSVRKQGFKIQKFDHVRKTSWEQQKDIQSNPNVKKMHYKAQPKWMQKNSQQNLKKF